MLKYRNFKMVIPDDKLSPQIESLVLDNNGSIFHDVLLNRIIEDTFGTELYYLVDNIINPQQICPIHITKDKNGLKTYSLKPLYDIPYSGFVGEVDTDLSELEVGSFESLKYAGFPYKLGKQDGDNYGQTCMVDLSLDEDVIFTSVIASKRRNMIRKASKNGIEVKRYFDLEGLEIFWPMLKTLHDRLGYEFLNYEYYKKIFSAYSTSKGACILIAFKDGRPLSGIFLLGNKNFTHYYKGASVFGERNEGQGELLQWEAIKLSKELGSNKYDLCNLNEDQLPEIYRFKTGISKTIYSYEKHSTRPLGVKLVNRLLK